MKGKFFSVGVGPGDPELLTLKAVRIIKNSDYIAVPESGAEENVAMKIAKEFIEGKNIIECDMPMTKDKEKMRIAHEKSAKKIAEILNKGEDVAFITLGDPAIYSTAMYVHRLIKAMGFETEMIPGVTSFSGAAASLDVSLCEGDEMLHIIPSTFKGTMDDLTGSRILMKSGRAFSKMKEDLIKENAMAVEYATMENERVFQNIKDMDDASYLTLIISPGRS